MKRTICNLCGREFTSCNLNALGFHLVCEHLGEVLTHPIVLSYLEQLLYSAGCSLGRKTKNYLLRNNKVQ